MATKPTVLSIDDEEQVVRSRKMMFRGSYDVIATMDPDEALAAVRSKQVHAVVSDQRMTGVEVLRSVREISPDTVRILLTGYSELDAVIASVNEGEIFRFVQKPWDSGHLATTLANAVAISQRLFDTDAPGSRWAPDDSEAIGVLVLDEDVGVMESVKEALGRKLAKRRPVYWCGALDEAFDTLARHRVGILVSKLRLGNDDISSGLMTLKQYYPETLTIILTSFRDTTGGPHQSRAGLPFPAQTGQAKSAGKESQLRTEVSANPAAST